MGLTCVGALPYHFAGLESIRTMLKEMGGPDAVPEAGDVIDMVQVCVCVCVCVYV